MFLKERYVPKDFVTFDPKLKLGIDVDESLGIEIYVSEDELKAIGYQGKAIKNAFHYRFAKVERTHEYIAKFINGLIASKAYKKEKRAERQSKKREMVVGDVLVSSWGYDQTNIDYYQVTQLVGNSSVELREIRGERTYEGQDCGQCVPIVNEFYGEPFVKRVTNGVRVKIDDCRSAWMLEFTLVEGMKVYRSNYWSSYA